MARTALVTGSSELAAAVTAALERRDHAVTVVDDRSRLADVCRDLGSAALDCYVQLPGSFTARGDNVVRLIRDFLVQGLLARFEAVECVLPTLRPDGVVVFVAGNQPPQAATPDDHGARLGLLRVLAHALLAEKADSDVRAMIVDHDRSADEIARIGSERGQSRLRVISEYAEHAPELDYADWRLEILALSRGEA